MTRLHPNVPPITPDQTLARLAATWAGASRVFHRHGLDFCCHGQVRLAEACGRKSLDLEQVLAEVRAATADSGPAVRWDQRPLADLVDHIEGHFHAAHRQEMPRLLAMARRVQQVHGENDSCPRGLAELFAEVQEDLLQHMQKEEQVLFPLLRRGSGGQARMSIAVLEGEHEQHGANLAKLRVLAHDFRPPADACGTWRALYLGLVEFERDVMQHIHLENNVLFPSALSDR